MTQPKYVEIILDSCSVAETVDGVDYINIDHVAPTFFTIYGRDDDYEDQSIKDFNDYASAYTYASTMAQTLNLPFINNVPETLHKD